ncbi:MAG: hypothetical protein H0V17_34140 [Deltaproteobacteria bacterium]|nr:hypothetical protein [Deltaproteobacteria bacterium]
MGFSALREYKTGEKPVDQLEPFLPPKIVIPPKPFKPFKPPIVVDTRAWYEKPSYRIAGGVTGAVAIGVVIYLLSSWDRSVFNSDDPGFEARRP